jgi:hypothetical protein
MKNKTAREIKTIKFKVLRKGETIDYQTVIEEIIGNEICKLSCYDPNYDCDPTYNDGEEYSHNSEKARAFFNPDCDYEIIIRPTK